MAKITVIKCTECAVWWRDEDTYIPCVCESGVWVLAEERDSEWGI